jgi:hypothetical protein
MKTTQPDKKSTFNATWKRIHKLSRGIPNRGNLPCPDFMEKIREARAAKGII